MSRQPLCTAVGGGAQCAATTGAGAANAAAAAAANSFPAVVAIAPSAADLVFPFSDGLLDLVISNNRLTIACAVKCVEVAWSRLGFEWSRCSCWLRRGEVGGEARV
jgi:hypothetical protein